MTDALRLDGRTIGVTRGDRVVFPDSGVTQAEVPTLDRPDRMIIDLDPGAGGVDDARIRHQMARAP